MTEYRIKRQWDRFWIEEKFLWRWIRTEHGRYSHYKTLQQAKDKLVKIQHERADKGTVVWP
jgi:hypothetical protein